MTAEDDLIAKLSALWPRQLERVRQLVDAFASDSTFEHALDSDFANDDFCQEFGDLLRMHHNSSSGPMSKDKVEFAMVEALKNSGHDAKKFSSGNPGADILVDDSPWSLKSQADAKIRVEKIHISKYMELGRGSWVTADDVAALRQQMFDHMTGYDRIFSLRLLSQTPTKVPGTAYVYELVEIPKSLLARAAEFPIEMKVTSTQNPQPASCYVRDADGELLFELYFDGGTERKLQVKHLSKTACKVHATWTFTASG